MSAILREEKKLRMPLNKLVDFVLDFCQMFSGRVFRPYQKGFSRGIIRSLLLNDGETLTALFARQTGKTQCCADTVSGIMILFPTLANLQEFADDERLQQFKNGLLVGIFAPNQRLSKIMFERIKDNFGSKTAEQVLAEPDFADVVFETSNGETVALSNGSSVSSVSASDNAKIEGASYGLIICDEAQDISDWKLTKSIYPMKAAFNGTAVLIGTPGVRMCFFLNAINQNRADDAANYGGHKKHYEINGPEAAKFNPLYAKSLEENKRLLGEDSDAYQVSFMLKWQIEKGMFLDLSRFLKINANHVGHRFFTDLKNLHVIGIDVASINDGLVATVVEPDWDNPVLELKSTNADGEQISYDAYHTVIKDWKEIQGGGNYETIFQELVDYIHLWRVAKIVIDGTRERAFAERLQAQLSRYCVVEIFIFTPGSKSDLYKFLDSEIKTGRAKFPNSDTVQQTREYKAFMEQMSELEKSYAGVNLVVNHPTTRGARDDYPDSYAMAIWGCSTPHLSKPQISVAKSDIFGSAGRGYNKNIFNNQRRHPANHLTARRR